MDDDAKRDTERQKHAAIKKSIKKEEYNKKRIIKKNG